jgi:hypothetical protein
MNHAQVVLLLWAAAGCVSPGSGTRTTSDSNQPRTECVRERIEVVRMQGTIIEYPPTPCRTTNLRFDVLQERIAEFQRREGQLPHALDELLELQVERPSIRAEPYWFVDGWETSLRYGPLGSSYELRSAGPDRHFETRDDLSAIPM